MPIPLALTPAELKTRLERGDRLVLLDVREDEEFAICHLPGSLHIPMGELSARLSELDPDAPTVCICHHGIRSASVAGALAERDFGEVYNLTGGVDLWSLEVDRRMPRY
jgi:rhodanese-related sulfurtransferase